MVKIIPSAENEGQKRRVLDPLLFKSISSGGLSYHKLPERPIKLSVLKLDGSSFDVFVGRNDKVAELKQAVEDVFGSSYKDEEAETSWSHVWGHFCLCYEGQKLLKDKVHIRYFGISDGDQLKFMQHMSIDYRPAKQLSKKTGATTRHSSMSSLRTSAHGEEKPISVEDSTNIVEDREEIQAPKFRLANLLKGQLSYAKLKLGSNF